MYFFFYSDEQLREAYRAAIRTMADMMTASLNGFQRVQNCQLDATQHVLSANADAAQRIDDATSINELTEIGNHLAWVQFDKFMSCWSALTDNIGMNQMEFIRHAQTQSMEAIDEMGRILDKVPLAPGSEPVVHALRLAVDTTRSSYEAGVRVMQEAERETAARIQAAANEVMQAAEEQSREISGEAEHAEEQGGDQQRQAA